MSFVNSLRELYLNNNSISSIKVSGLREYLSANKIIFIEDNRVVIILDFRYKWILDTFHNQIITFFLWKF